MKVRAKGVEGKVVGFDGTKRRRGGEVFDWPEGVPLGSWVEAADPNDKRTAEAVAKTRAEVTARIEHAKLVQQQGGVNQSAQIAALEKQLAALKGQADRSTTLQQEIEELRAENEALKKAKPPAK